jgi:hypothetical protein
LKCRYLSYSFYKHRIRQATRFGAAAALSKQASNSNGNQPMNEPNELSKNKQSKFFK